MTLKDFKDRYSSKERARRRRMPTRCSDQYAEKQRLIERGPHSHRAPGHTGHRHHRRFRILDPGQGRRKPCPPLRRDRAVPRQGADKAGACRSQYRPSERAQQLKAEVDRSKTVLLNVPIVDVYNALQAQFGSIQSASSISTARIWNVVLQSDAPYRETPIDMTKLYTRSATGQMVPLVRGQRPSYVTGPDLVPHFNGFPAPLCTGSAAAGYSSGDAHQGHGGSRQRRYSPGIRVFLVRNGLSRRRSRAEPRPAPLFSVSSSSFWSSPPSSNHGRCRARS